VFELCLLRLVDAPIGTLEISAGVNHGSIQPELIELVRDIVMKPDRVPIRVPGMRDYRAVVGKRAPLFGWLLLVEPSPRLDALVE